MNWIPQILIPRGISKAVLTHALAETFALPGSHVFDEARPAVANTPEPEPSPPRGAWEPDRYDRLFTDGHLVVHHYARGVFEWMAEGVLAEDVFGPDALRALSARLGVPVGVDRSRSDAEPNYVLHTPDAITEHVAVGEHEDADGDPYWMSRAVEAAVEEMRDSRV